MEGRLASLWLWGGVQCGPPRGWAGCQEGAEGVVAALCLPRVCEKPAPDHSHHQAAFQPVPVGPALLPRLSFR